MNRRRWYALLFYVGKGVFSCTALSYNGLK